MEPLDIQALYSAAKAQWLKSEAPRRSFMDQIERSIPWWLVIIAGVFFLLSAPHTAAVFNQITPVFGVGAPFGVEFGLLYAAFVRKRNGAVSRWLLGFEMFLIVTSVLVNGAGALTSVVQSAGLTDLSWQALIDHFGALPFVSQVGIIMAALSAFIIPAGAVVAGEGLADLIIRRQEGDDWVERQWRAVEADILYRALYAWFSKQGETARIASTKARSETRGYLTSVGADRMLPERAGNAGMPENAELPRTETERPALSKGEARAKLETLFRDNPALFRDVPAVVALTGVSKTQVYEFRKMKQQENADATQ